jgi:hypothetical protein
MIKETLAFVNELLLLGNIFQVRLLRTLEPRILYRSTQIHTNKKLINKKQYINQYKQSKIM